MSRGNDARLSRRRFLRGLGGAVVALPFLDATRVRRAMSGPPPAPPVYAFFVRQGNGCQQAYPGRGEPERFWPRALGALTRDGLAVDNADRTVAVLADHADRLILVRGTRFGFPGEGCAHSGGLNQCLTAAAITGEGSTSLALGESIDWFLAQRNNPAGVEPLTLMAGPQNAYIAHGLSYSGPSRLRGAQNNPFAAYTDLVGLAGASPDLLALIAARRQSVNDLVRGELQDLLARPELSSADRTRLDAHFSSIRDLEVGMACALADADVAAIEAISQASEANQNRVAIADFMLQIAALAFACDATRAGTLQVGSGNDGTRYTVDGVLQNSYHRISHRIDSDGSTGPTIPDADILHHKIDLIHAGVFKRFLDRLAAYPGPSGGSLLDDAVVVWTNDLGVGPSHSYENVPQVIAGRAGGYLRTGQYIDAGNVTHNRLLDTLINAAGVRAEGGAPFEGFGAPSLPRGLISAMIA